MPTLSEPRGTEIAGLIAEAQAGNIAAFERLIALHQDRIYRFARTYTKDKEEAADLAQEALLKVYRSLPGFRSQSSFTTWLYRVVRNTFLDHVKSRRSKESQVETPLSDVQELRKAASEDEGAEAGLLRAEEHKALWAAIEKVPETYRVVLVMADMEGQSYEEIAAIVEAPLGTVKSRLKRGRDALREILQKNTSE